MTRGRVVAIIQARMSSTRLPGKSLMDLGGHPVVRRVVDRVRSAASLDDVVMAITDQPGDDSLEEYAAGMGVSVVRGSTEDVLSRFVQAADAHPAEAYVRITADCPLIDPDAIDAVVAGFTQGAGDYCSNTLRRTYPIGMDCEVFSSAALRLAAEEGTSSLDREHVTPFIYQHPERFSLINIEAPEWAIQPDLRLTVDEAADLEMIREIVKRVGADAGLREILELLDREPSIASINSSVVHRHVDKPAEW